MSEDNNDFIPSAMPILVPPTGNGKRPRRMRSMQGAAHYGNGQKGKKGPGAKQVEYHDRKKAAPIFLQKTFEMINTCDENIASWTPDGKMFVIKDQQIFEQTIIPKFFDHNKFSSFARQLNFYGFRKMQARPIYKDDADTESSKHVTFFNEKFQRGRPELLKDIQRSTKGGQASQSEKEMQKEIDMLKERVGYLENTVQEYSYRFASIETQLQQFLSYSTNGNNPTGYPATSGHVQDQGNFSYGTGVQHNQQTGNVDSPYSDSEARPTLAPHPNSKVLPGNARLPAPPNRQISFMRGFSTYSMGDTFSPFEQKMLESALTGPDPVETAIDYTLKRDVSQGLERLDLNELPLDEFPPLGT